MRAWRRTLSRSADSQRGIFTRHSDASRRTHRHPIVVGEYSFVVCLGLRSTTRCGVSRNSPRTSLANDRELFCTAVDGFDGRSLRRIDRLGALGGAQPGSTSG
jgi:hypothetical protein